MRTDFYYESCAADRIHGCCWMPSGPVKAIVQIVHGIAEHILRYDDFAEFLNTKNIMVVGEDHMGHGQTADCGGSIGFFEKGWFSAVQDTCTLSEKMIQRFPNLPFFLFGHSMGSFIVRTMLWKYPELPITGCIISGTGWQSPAIVRSGSILAKTVCKLKGERSPSKGLQKVIFGGYQSRIEEKKTEFDWLTRDPSVIDSYMADPKCGFIPSCGLIRDMLEGMTENERMVNLRRMNPNLPILFTSGGYDPVGNYGEGVSMTANHFKNAGIQDVTVQIFPLFRHEILNEINKEAAYAYIYKWIEKNI